MLPSPGPRFYLAGALLAALGGLLLWFRRSARARPRTRSTEMLIAAIVALILGSSLIGAGVWIDWGRFSEENTRILTYHVSVRTNGTGPVRLVLPAPADARFFSGLNATNGSSTLRLDDTGSVPQVVVTALTNVTLDVRAEVFASSGDWTFTRVTFAQVGSEGAVSNASIELTGTGSSAGVRLGLDLSIGWFCEVHRLTLDSLILPGLGDYPALTPMIVC